MEGILPKEGPFKGDKEVEDKETYTKLSVIHVIKRDT